MEELAQEKLSPLLQLRYNNALADALADLGEPEQIAGMFAGFQRFLYVNHTGGETHRPNA